MAESLYEIKFLEPKATTKLCTVHLTPRDIELFHNAIEDLYYFEFFIAGDLPVRGFIGQLEERVLPHSHTVYLWTHLHFVFEHNGFQIVAANVSEKEKGKSTPTEIELPEDVTLEVDFTYSVEWRENKNLPFKNRHLKDSSFFPKSIEIHWLSILNSTVLITLLVAFVTLIVKRMLNKDFDRFSKDEDDIEMDEDMVDDHGWKNLHTDVFRFPAYKSLLCAIVGNGLQFLALATGIIMMALFGMFNIHHHGSMNTAAIVLYAVTCGFSGYASSRLYKSLEGLNWVWNIVMTSCVFSVPFFVIWSVTNSVAWYTGSTQALPFTTIVLLMLVWLMMGFPLTVVGGIAGKNSQVNFDAPCRTKNIVREIPNIPYYKSALAHVAIGGFLPFSAISVELYFIFATVWGRDRYTLYGILFVVFINLLIVTACVAVTLTYFQLSAEDHRWWWRSLLSSGATGLFVLMYAVFYFQYRSSMTGTLQTVQFFGATLLGCYVFFLMLGTVGFLSSLRFVRYIYSHVKLD